MDHLAVDEIVRCACDEAGSNDFGDDDPREALGVLVEAINTESHLGGAARAEKRQELVADLVTRLRMEDYFVRHPEIDDQRVVAPLVIIGLQRTGTSKLFRAIASDPRWLVLRTWQGRYPVPLGSERTPHDPGPRRELTRQWVERVTELGMQPAHRIDVDAPEMEFLLLTKTFMFPSPMLIVPTHQRWCETADYVPVYRYFERQLKFLQWQNGDEPGRRWLLKYPYHLANLDALVEVFPDCTLVMNHRNPTASVASMMRIAEMMQEGVTEDGDPRAMAHEWFHILALELDRCLAYRDSPQAKPIVDVAYRDVVADAADVVRAVYEAADTPFDAATAGRILDWEQENPAHRDGAFHYDLADYGLSEQDVRARFADYLRRFGALT